MSGPSKQRKGASVDEANKAGRNDYSEDAARTIATTATKATFGASRQRTPTDPFSVEGCKAHLH